MVTQLIPKAILFSTAHKELLIHSAFPMDSGEDDLYYSNGGEEDEEEDGITLSEPDDELAPVDNWASVSLPQQKTYRILDENEIKRRLEEDISTIRSVLFVSRGVASALLYRYSWMVGRVQEEWFGDEEKVRKFVGISDELAEIKELKTQICAICFEEPCGTDGMISASCGAHLFCADCWRNYISTSINGGSGCLTLPCPEPKCESVVLADMVESLASEEDKEKYYKYLMRSYIEDSKNRKWCPAPGCYFAIEYASNGIGSECESYDVSCDCSHQFCWNCLEKCHRPLDCELVRKWIEKNNSEAQNTIWILAYTKPCPKCKRPIEKNQGCSHMRCRICHCDFCWLCLTPYDRHGTCNRYTEEKDKDKAMAKKHLARYTHYYERWAANNKSMQMAMADLNNVKTEHIQKLAMVVREPESQLHFLTEAWEQIVECRRVLMWTYAYGYYIPEKEHRKMSFFEFLQGEAESGLEKLHQCAEKEMEPYLDGSGGWEEFKNFRTKLAGLTTVTRNYFENLVRGLENGLSEVESTSTRRKKPRN